MLSFNVLKLRDFRILFLTRLCGLMALQAQAVIVGWQVYSITKDPFMLGLVGLVEAVPAITAALFAGYIVDISRPHRVFVICVVALTLNTVMLFIIAGGNTSIHGHDLIPWIFGGVFLSGLARSFLIPSSFSLLPQIVPRSEIPAASAWMTSGFQIGIIAGPALAGIIYGGYGVKIAWMFPLALMVIEFVLACSFSSTHKQFRSKQVREKASKSIKMGWQFIWKNPVLLSIMSLDMFAVLFGGAVAMLPAFADQILHVGSEGLGALRAAPALGAVITTLFLAVRPFKTIHASLLLYAVVGFGFCMIGFGLSTTFWAAMIFLALSGMFDSVSMVIRQTLVQWLTPEMMRGRVSSINSMFVISSNEIGAFESGLAARLLGLAPSIIFGGVSTLVVVALTALASPKLRKLKITANQE